MSNQTFSTFSSSTTSSYTSSSGHRYEEHTSSNPTGTTIHRTTQEAGQPAVSETTRIPVGGQAGQNLDGLGGSRRIEDVSDEKENEGDEYEERIEEEYAKREGGA